MEQAIIKTSAVLLSVGPLRMGFSEIFDHETIVQIPGIKLKICYAKWRPYYLGLHMLSIGGGLAPVHM